MGERADELGKPRPPLKSWQARPASGRTGMPAARKNAALIAVMMQKIIGNGVYDAIRDLRTAYAIQAYCFSGRPEIRELISKIFDVKLVRVIPRHNMLLLIISFVNA